MYDQLIWKADLKQSFQIKGFCLEKILDSFLAICIFFTFWFYLRAR